MISYSGLTNYGKANLPSIEGWGQTMNIVKDPPRSVMTRYIEKVGQNNYMNDEIEESNDRAAEYINVYARGVNPSVNVSFGNYQNQSLTGNTKVTQSYLPYRIMKDGAFRPPVMTKEELTPLSRQARPNTTVFTQAYFPNYTKTITEDHEEYKAIKLSTLHTSIKPTATYRLEKPLDYFDTKHNIKDIVAIDKSAGKSGMKSMDITETTVGVPVGGIKQDPIYAYGYTNKTDLNSLNNFNQVVFIEPTGGIKETPLQVSGYTNKNDNNRNNVLDVIDPTRGLKNQLNVSYDTIKTGYTTDTKNYQDIHLNKKLSSEFTTNKFQNIESKPIDSSYQIELTRNRPLIEIQSQKTSSGNFSDVIVDREVKLADKLNYGEFDTKQSFPMKIEDRVFMKLKNKRK